MTNEKKGWELGEKLLLVAQAIKPIKALEGMADTIYEAINTLATPQGDASTDSETEADNAKAADWACLAMIAQGYYWNGGAWARNGDASPEDGVLRCEGGCGLAYSDFGLDMVLPDDQWERISPEGGVMCANCIVKRASKLDGGVTCMFAAFDQLSLKERAINQGECHVCNTQVSGVEARPNEIDQLRQQLRAGVKEFGDRCDEMDGKARPVRAWEYRWHFY